MQIPHSLVLLFHSTLDEQDDSENGEDEYTISIPKSLVDGEELSTDTEYKLALINPERQPEQGVSTTGQGVGNQDGGKSQSDVHHQSGDNKQPSTPPVSEGETRTVTIESTGDQGDGIAKIDGGYVIVVEDARKGDKVEIEIDTVTKNCAFASVVDIISSPTSVPS